MPTSGYEIIKKLREKAGHRSKIAYVSILPKSDVNMSDADGFIQKPFKNEDFLAGVKSLLRGKNG